MFEQQKLKSDHKDQIGKTCQRAKDLLYNATLLVEDLQKANANAEDITEAIVDSARHELEEAAVEPYKEYIKQIQSTSRPLSLLSLDTPALNPEKDFIVRTDFSKRTTEGANKTNMGRKTDRSEGKAQDLDNCKDDCCARGKLHVVLMKKPCSSP